MSRRICSETEQRWRGILERQQGSGLTVQAFCEGEGVSVPSFYSWRRKLRERDGASTPQRSTSDGAAMFVSLGPLGAAPTLEIVHPLGCRIRVTGSVCLATLRHVLQALNEGGGFMIALAPQVRVLLYRAPTDMRKSFNGLVALIESAMQQDPLSGSLFVFVNARKDRIKILYWGQTGYCIWYQQLQQGTFQLPPAEETNEQASLEVTRAQLSLILDGIDLSSVRQRPRFQLPQAAAPT